MVFVPTADGYVEPNRSSFKYVFQCKDHLGNVRLSYSDADKNGSIATTEIVEESNYYPFGLKHSGYNDRPATDYKYKYNGKEYQDDDIGGFKLNLYDYGARNYDPAIGRWMNIDPKAEESRRFSPYVYANDNPVFFIDPDGMSAVENGDPTYLLQSVNYNKKTGNYTIKENVSVSNSNSSTQVNAFGATKEVTNTTNTSANFTTVINSKGEIVSKSNTVETTKTTTERDTSNVFDLGKVSCSETKTSSDKNLTGPLATAFSGSVDGMKDLVVPLKSDQQKFRETTPDVPGAGDGTTGGFGRLGESLINYARGTANQYSSAVTKSNNGKLGSNDFNNSGYINYSKALNIVGTTLNKK